VLKKSICVLCRPGEARVRMTTVTTPTPPLLARLVKRIGGSQRRVCFRGCVPVMAPLVGKLWMRIRNTSGDGRGSGGCGLLYGWVSQARRCIIQILFVNYGSCTILGKYAEGVP
jgi:hypothetical protein